MPTLNFGSLSVTLTVGGSPAVEAWLKSQTSITNTTLTSILAALNLLGQKTDAVITLEKTEMINVQALTDAVTRETSVDDSIIALLQNLATNQTALSAQLAAALAANDPVAIAAAQKAIDDSATAMTANSDRIAAAVVANTPAAA